jgi:hypothetical protein
MQAGSGFLTDRNENKIETQFTRDQALNYLKMLREQYQ